MIALWIALGLAAWCAVGIVVSLVAGAAIAIAENDRRARVQDPHPISGIPAAAAVPTAHRDIGDTALLSTAAQR